MRPAPPAPCEEAKHASLYPRTPARRRRRTRLSRPGWPQRCARRIHRRRDRHGAAPAGIRSPPDRLVSLAGLLDGRIEVGPQGLRLGAAATMAEVAAHT